MSDIELQQVKPNDLLFSTDTSSLLPTAISPMKYIISKKKTAFVFTRGIKDELVKRFNRNVIAVKTTEKLTADSVNLK